MKKDLNSPVVKDIAVAVVKDKNDEQEDIWNVYIINYQQDTISNYEKGSKSVEPL